MSEKALVSVLIPAYNHEKYVQEAIKSIIDQTYENIELLVVDDGSKDNTWQKIQEMKEKCENRFSRVVFETKENSGICSSLNRLKALAQGEFIFFLASDDFAKPNCIEKEVDFLIKNPNYSLCTCNSDIIDSNSNVCFWDEHRKTIYDKAEAKYLTFADWFQDFRGFSFKSDKFGRYDVLYLGNHVPNGNMVRANIFNRIGDYSIDAPLEDWWLMLQIAKYSKLKYIDEILFSYRWHESNTMQDNAKITFMTDKTRESENKLLSKINTKEVNKEVIDVIKNGVVYRKYFSIPYIFEVLFLYKTDGKKHRVIKLFNIKIFEWFVENN